MENNERKSNKVVVIVLVVLLVISLGVGGYFGYKYFANKPSSEQQSNNQQKTNNNNQQYNFKYKLKLCANKEKINNDRLYSTYYYDTADKNLNLGSACSDEIIDVGTESENAKLLDSSKEYVLYLDNNIIKIYDVANNKYTNYNEVENNYDLYSIISFEDKLYGISYLKYYGEDGREYEKYNEFKYYDIKENKKKYDNYYIVRAIGNDLISAIDSNNKKGILFDYNTDKQIISSESYYSIDSSVISGRDIRYYAAFEVIDNFIEKINSPELGPYSAITYYTMDGKKIYFDEEGYDSEIINNNLYVISNNYLQKYSSDGNVASSKQYSNEYSLEAIYDNFAVVVKNKELYMINMDTFEELFVTKLNAGDEFIDYESGSYDSKNNKLEKGIYCICFSHNYESKYLIFNTKTKQIEKEN